MNGSKAYMFLLNFCLYMGALTREGRPKEVNQSRKFLYILDEETIHL